VLGFTEYYRVAWKSSYPLKLFDTTVAYGLFAVDQNCGI